MTSPSLLKYASLQISVLIVVFTEAVQAAPMAPEAAGLTLPQVWFIN